MAGESNEEAAEAGSKEPSFEGRLQLKNFMFGGGSSSKTPVSAPAASGIRHSSRLLMTSHSSPSPSSSSAAAPSPKRKSPSPSPSPSKRRKHSARYAPPSTYAHLPYLPDAIGPGLLILFIGLNPGLETARTGHAYAHPSNLFWKLLHSSGITPGATPCRASEDRGLPRRFGGLGFTNIVARPSRSGAELSGAEMDAGVAALEAKCRRWRPECVCVVGKGIWESLDRVWRRRRGDLGKGGGREGFVYGWQSERMGTVPPARDGEDPRDGEGGEEEEEEGGETTKTTPWEGARIFVATSTSGLAASLRPEEKERIWKVLGDWCVRRRREREEEQEAKNSAARRE
ncbi:hydrolase-like protein [Biscogniauxia marginata]|nr:hydrolase-like protein [Biscogniauxia marginata]